MFCYGNSEQLVQTLSNLDHEASWGLGSNLQKGKVAITLG